MKPRPTPEEWARIAARIQNDTWEPYQEEVIPHEILDLPCIEVPKMDTGPIYSIDDPIQHAVRRIPLV
jgi:hypothetical protein